MSMAGHDTIRYMGQEIPKSSLPSATDIIGYLESNGAFDKTLDHYRRVYHDCLGKDLIWRYPFSDGSAGGSTIIPVREGFLLLHYDEVFKDTGARYILKDSEMLSAEGANTFLKECRSYTDGLCSALADMELVLTDAPEISYTDSDGNVYFVRGGIGQVYKGFKRYAVPRRGRRETGIRSLLYRKDRAQAQRDLDEYANAHGLTVVPESTEENTAAVEGAGV